MRAGTVAQDVQQVAVAQRIGVKSQLCRPGRLLVFVGLNALNFSLDSRTLLHLSWPCIGSHCDRINISPHYLLKVCSYHSRLAKSTRVSQSS